MRGRGSDQNLRNEIRRLEQVIDMLQRDQHDYGGHRVQAIQDLQQAREQLEARCSTTAGTDPRREKAAGEARSSPAAVALRSSGYAVGSCTIAMQQMSVHIS